MNSSHTKTLQIAETNDNTIPTQCRDVKKKKLLRHRKNRAAWCVSANNGLHWKKTLCHPRRVAQSRVRKSPQSALERCRVNASQPLHQTLLRNEAVNNSSQRASFTLRVSSVNIRWISSKRTSSYLISLHQSHTLFMLLQDTPSEQICIFQVRPDLLSPEVS